MTATTATTQPYAVTVIGQVAVASADPGQRPLSAAKRQLLALLVAAGPDGVDGDDLVTELSANRKPISQAALRMAVARLRDHLSPDVLPESDHGVYRLRLDSSQVDAWHLDGLAGRGAALGTVTDAQLHHLLRPADPFARTDPSLVIEEAAARLRRQQRELVMDLVERHPDRVVGDLLDVMRRHRDEDPFNERLLYLTVLRLARDGDRRAAINLIGDAQRAFREVGLNVNGQLLAVEQQLLDGTFALPVSAVQGTETRRSRLDDGPVDGALDSGRDAVDPQRPLPARLRDQLELGYVGDRRTIDELAGVLGAWPTPRHALVEGVSGSGKTRLLAELAHHALGREWAVVYVAGTDGGVEGAFGPFLAALPDLRERAGNLLDDGVDPATRRAAIWLAAREAITSGTGTARTLLLVDDVQWLDSQSLGLVGHLLGSNDDQLAIVVAGRSDAASRSAWGALRDTAVRSVSTHVETVPLTVEELRDIVRSRRPRMSASTLWALADELHRASGGRPGVAIVMLASIGGGSALPDRRALDVPSDLADPAQRGLSAAALHAGLGAAVLGEEFDVSTLVAVTGLSGDEALDAVDELVRHDLLTERTLTTFATAHALVDAAFVQQAARSDVVRTHQCAAELFADDVHRRARHLREAVAVVDRRVVAEALLESARLHVDEHLYLEASRAYGAAVELLAGDLATDDAIRYSRALDLAGLHDDAEQVRSTGFDAALVADDHRTALRFATSGLPEAEPVDGAPVLVTRLRSLAVDRLDPDDAWARARHLARHLAIVGDLAGASAAAADAAACANRREQHLASALVRRFAISATSDPAERLALLDELEPLATPASPDVAGEFLVVRAIDHYEAGDRERALDAIARLERIDRLPVVRRWHAQMLRAMVTADDGDAEAAAAMRLQAFETASRAGLREAEHAFLIGGFTDLFLGGAAGVLVESVHDGRLDPDVNTVMRAGVCAVLAAAGEREAALPHAEQVAAAVVASPVSQGIAALAYVADALGDSTDAVLCAQAREMLRSRGESLLVVAAGAACIGPIDRYVAMLTDDPDERRRRLDAAACLAARTGQQRWVDLVAESVGSGG